MPRVKILPYLLVILPVIPSGQCDSATSAFIFPSVSDPAAPDISNQNFTKTDNVTVEYTQFPHTTAVSIGILCFDTIQHALGNDSVTCTTSPGQGPYRNTGRVKFALGDEDASTFQYNPCLQPSNYIVDDSSPNLTYCRFQIYNNSVESCSWGPWGQGSQIQANSSIPISSSPVFRVLDTNTTNSTPRASKSATVTPETTTISVTCPATGIPSQPVQIFRQNEDIWPPLADNLTFPVLSNELQRSLISTLIPGVTPVATPSSTSSPEQTSQ